MLILASTKQAWSGMISRAIHLNKSTSIITNGSLAIMSLFYLFCFASFYGLTVTGFEGRTTFDYSYADHYVISGFADHLIIISTVVLWITFAVGGMRNKSILLFIAVAPVLLGLISSKALDIISLILPILVVLLLILNRVRYQIFVKRHKEKKGGMLIEDAINSRVFLNFLTIIGLALAIFGLVLVVGRITSLGFFQNITGRNYVVEIGWLLAYLSPVYIFILVNGVATKILGEQMITRLRHLASRNRTRFIKADDTTVHLV